MIPVYQRNRHVPAASIYGDCLRASVASVLELALDDVPHFMHGLPAPEVWIPALKTWAKSRGLDAVFVAGAPNLSDTLAMMAHGFPGRHYVLAGTAPGGLQHAVVGYGDRIVHNPSRRRDDRRPHLTAPLCGGRYAAIVFQLCVPEGALPPNVPPVNFEPLQRHANVGLQFSGGKDSLAMLHVLRPYWDRLTVYHCDPGDQLPEMRAIVGTVEALVPRFVQVKADVRGWIAANGTPSRVVPVHCLSYSRVIYTDQGNSPGITDKMSCCANNRMLPIKQRMDADGVTLVIRGTRRSEAAYGAFANGPGHQPSAHSKVFAGSPVEYWLPIEDWSDDQVFSYLRSIGVKLPRTYEHLPKGIECARCPVWTPGHAAYLKRYHPGLAAEYGNQLRMLHREIETPLRALKGELDALAA